MLFMEARLVGGTIRLSEQHDSYEWMPAQAIRAHALPAGIRDFILAYAERKES